LRVDAQVIILMVLSGGNCVKFGLAAGAAHPHLRSP